MFFKNAISLSDIGHLSLSRLFIARLSIRAFTFFSTTVLSVHGSANPFQVPTAFVQSLPNISSILLTTDCASSFCKEVGGSNHALKLAQSLSVNPFCARVSFHCLSSFVTLPRSAISLSENCFVSAQDDFASGVLL